MKGKEVLLTTSVATTTRPGGIRLGGGREQNYRLLILFTGGKGEKKGGRRGGNRNTWHKKKKPHFQGVPRERRNEGSCGGKGWGPLVVRDTSDPDPSTVTKGKKDRKTASSKQNKP